MNAIDLRDLLLLAALWGASFLFMRLGAADFGPIVLIELRVSIAGLFLLPWLVRSPVRSQLREYGPGLLLLGTVNSALPFCLIAYSTLFVSAGFASILNATSPMFGALVGALWYRHRFTGLQLLGLGLGFSGVAVLFWDQASLPQGHAWIPVLAGLGAALAYGVGANFSKSRLESVNPLVIAGGSQLGAALVLLPAAIGLWPQQSPPLGSWLSVLALGTLCTGFAYLLYFRLIARAGPLKAITVTYLVPVFAMVWGGLWLGERVTWQMLTACGVILLGTALATGILSHRLSNR